MCLGPDGFYNEPYFGPSLVLPERNFAVGTLIPRVRILSTPPFPCFDDFFFWHIENLVTLVWHKHHSSFHFPMESQFWCWSWCSVKRFFVCCLFCCKNLFLNRFVRDSIFRLRPRSIACGDSHAVLFLAKAGAEIYEKPQHSEADKIVLEVSFDFVLFFPFYCVVLKFFFFFFFFKGYSKQCTISSCLPSSVLEQI